MCFDACVSLSALPYLICLRKSSFCLQHCRYIWSNEVRWLQLGLTSTKGCDAFTGVNYQLLPPGGSHDLPKISLTRILGCGILIVYSETWLLTCLGNKSSSTHSLRTNVLRLSKLIDGWISARQRIGSPKKKAHTGPGEWLSPPAEAWAAPAPIQTAWWGGKWLCHRWGWGWGNE